MQSQDIIASTIPFQVMSTATAKADGRPTLPNAADDISRFRVMIVDDEPSTLYIIRRWLEGNGYTKLISTADPAQALPIARSSTPDIVLLDVNMPKMSGFDVLQQLQSEMPDVPVIFLTASDDRATRLQALNLGVMDFLNKPLDGVELMARVRNVLTLKDQRDRLRDYSLHLETEVLARTEALELSRQELIQCLARAAEFRDDTTGHHIVRVGRYVRLIAERLGYPRERLRKLELAARLHDIGKIGIPDAILLKSGRLSPSEYDVMQKHCYFGKQIIDQMPPVDEERLRQHPELGSRILGVVQSPLLELARSIALTHHERWDGQGYPQGLAGDEIPLEGRITAVADVFDALSTKRPYKPAYPLEQCLQIMEQDRGRRFDPAVLDAFLAAREEVALTQVQLADDM